MYKAHYLLNAGFVNCYQLCHGTKAQMSYLVVIVLDLYSCPSCPMSIKTHMQVQGSWLQNKFLKLLNRKECQDFMISKPIKKTVHTRISGIAFCFTTPERPLSHKSNALTSQRMN